MVSDSQIKMSLKRNYGISDARISDLKGHIDKVVRVDSSKGMFVYKIYLNKKFSKKQLLAQLGLINYLKKLGVGVPDIINTKLGDNYSAITDYRKRYGLLWQYINNLQPLVLDNVSEAKQLANWVAEYHKHCLSYTGVSNWYYEPIATEEKKSVYMKNYIGRYRRTFCNKILQLRNIYLSDYKKLSKNLSTAMLNNDLANSNLFKVRGKYMLVDWNTSGNNYLADELSWIISWFFIDKERMDLLGSFVDVYLSKINLNQSEKSVLSFLPLVHSFLSWKTIESVKNKSDVEAVLKKMLQTEKILKKAFR